jgi:hypothetical protein
MAFFSIKVGDTSPPLTATCTLPSGFDLTDATEVRFQMKKAGGAQVGGVCTVLSATRVQYEWAVGDTSSAGAYKGKFEAEWADGSVMSIPNTGHVDVKIEEDASA